MEPIQKKGWTLESIQTRQTNFEQSLCPHLSFKALPYPYFNLEGFKVVNSQKNRDFWKSKGPKFLIKIWEIKDTQMGGNRTPQDSFQIIKSILGLIPFS